MARIQVSFKNNDIEDALYKEVLKSYDKSAFIKECIRFYLDNRYEKIIPKEEAINIDNEIDNVDWEF